MKAMIMRLGHSLDDKRIYENTHRLHVYVALYGVLNGGMAGHIAWLVAADEGPRRTLHSNT